MKEVFLINMTIVDFLKDRANRNANDLVFRFMGNGELDGPITEWTFSELYHQSVGVAEDLVEQGHKGSSVLLAFPPGLDFVKAFFGCLLAQVRAVPVPLPNPHSKNPLGRLLNTACPNFWVNFSSVCSRTGSPPFPATSQWLRSRPAHSAGLIRRAVYS